jgi:hypothetical protein
VERSVVWAGVPGRSFGTGVIISRRHRLVATAAHVADDLGQSPEQMSVVPSGLTAAYRVARIWYHPGIERALDVGLYARSPDPRDGDIRYRTPDVAVLQLAAGGPELPVECVLASDEELRSLSSQAEVGHLGYTEPVHSDFTRPSPAHPQSATGLVTAMFDLGGDPDAPAERRQWIQSSARLGSGASGGPLFLASGRVVGLYQGDVKDGPGDWKAEFCRADLVREILAYHHIPGSPECAARSQPRADWGPDPRLDRLRRAVSLVREAVERRRRGACRDAVLRCNEAIDLAPEYAWARLQRGKAYLYYLGSNWTKLTYEERRRYSNWASLDTKRCIEALPSEAEPLLYQAQINIYIAGAYGNESIYPKNIEFIDRLLARFEDLTDVQFARAYSCRAQCRHFQGDWGGALRDYNRAIALDRAEPRHLLNRAQYWEHAGRPDRASEDRRAAHRLRADTAPTARRGEAGRRDRPLSERATGRGVSASGAWPGSARADAGSGSACRFGFR